MNNKHSFQFLKSKSSVREASNYFINEYDLLAELFHTIRYKFGELTFTSRELYMRKSGISTWEE